MDRRSSDIFISSRRKTFWREPSPDLWSFYCPLCRSSRKVPYRSRPGGVRQISQIALTAAFFTLVTWSWFGWKGIVAVVPFWTVFEIVYRGRMRAALNCDACGFDPYLYLIDVKRARKEVEDHWRKKFQEKGVPYPEKNPPELPLGPRTPPPANEPSLRP